MDALRTSLVNERFWTVVSPCWLAGLCSSADEGGLMILSLGAVSNGCSFLELNHLTLMLRPPIRLRETQNLLELLVGRFMSECSKDSSMYIFIYAHSYLALVRSSYSCD